MSLPSSYLTSTKNLGPILTAVQGAQAPKQFSTRFLATLGFPSVNDRLVIGVLKALKFLSPEGQPTKRYFEYLDSTQSKRVLAEGIREAYADLFQLNRKAHELSNSEVKNKFKTLSQGQASDSVLDKMAGTFKALSQHADFSAIAPHEEPRQPAKNETIAETLADRKTENREPPKLGGLVYNIQLILPADRDQAVYDALFRSLKEHLF